MKKLLLLLTLIPVLFAGCSTKNSAKSIAVFVPGIIDDSPTYAKLTRGVQKAVAELNEGAKEEDKINLQILEAGTNQAEWSAKITSLVAEGKYDVIISSNPSLPDLVEPIIKQFPSQKFILLDATKEGNANCACLATINFRSLINKASSLTQADDFVQCTCVCVFFVICHFNTSLYDSGVGRF